MEQATGTATSGVDSTPSARSRRRFSVIGVLGELLITAGVILDEPDDGQRFAVMRIPRFGSDYAVEMAGGVSRDGGRLVHLSVP